MSAPLISIVLTTYNRCRLLPNAVRSVLDNGYSNVEVLIIDDASTDGTEDYASKLTDERIRYVRMPENGGVLRARNRGLELVRGDLVAFLDDDDELVANALQVIADQFADMQQSGSEILWFNCVDAEAGTISGVMPIGSGPIPFEDYLCGRVHGDFWMVFQRSTILQYRFDEKLKAHESLLWLRMHRKHKASFVPAVVCKKYREHGGPRLCDIDVRMGQLRQTTLAMSQFIDEFGNDLRKASPTIYGRKLAYLGLYQMAIGEFSIGRSFVIHSLRHRFSIKYLVLCLGSYFMSKQAIVGLIRRAEVGAGLMDNLRCNIASISL